MNKVIMRFCLFALWLLGTLPYASGQTAIVVYDVKSAEQAATNGVAAKASEELIRSEFEEVKDSQRKIRNLLLVVEGHIAKVEKIQKDVSAFKKEGAALSLIAFKAKKALSSLGELAPDLKSNQIGIVGSYKVISTLSADIYGICANVVGVVVDGSFDLPGLSKVNKGKSVNFLEPQERLAFFERCNYDLDLIIFKIHQIHLEIISTNTLNLALQKVAPRSMWTINYGLIVANDIVDLWKK